MSPQPLVSVIIRSMGRPELAEALESVARQDYPSLETVVVDATGGRHPPLPSFPRCNGHVIRMVGGERPLPRAHAANVGLLAARGEWLCFLDDDDTYDRHFVSAMEEAARDHPEALVVYGRVRILRADGEIERLFGRPFNRALMHYGPLFCWPAAFIRRKVVDLGCRFDETLDVCEDRDFLAQIARHSDFVFVPVVGCNCRPHLGTSGTAEVNRDVANTIRYDALVRAKEAGPGAYHTRCATRQCARAISAYHAGDRARSRELLEALLREYPDDPNGLHALARIELEEGLPDHAETLVSRAIDINPNAAEFRSTRAMILKHLGRPEETIAAPGTAPASRLVPCPCGSGKRYKQCCGRPVESARSEGDRVVEQARAWLVRGEAARAKGLIDTLAPAEIGNPDLSRTAGEICFDLGSFEQAYAFLDRSAKLKSSSDAGVLLSVCCDFIWRDRTRESARAMVLNLRERIEKRASAHRSAALGPIHLLGTFGKIGGSESRAAGLYRILSPHADVRLWSTAPPLEQHYAGLPIEMLDTRNGAFPDRGALVLAGHYFDCGDWWREAAFDRVVICVNLDAPLELVHRMADIEQAQTARIDFTFPSRLCRDFFGLPGVIEYPPVDVTRFAGAASRPGNRLTIGRHSRDVRQKHHPNGPALYRQLAARGHRTRLLGGTCLQAAFSGDPARSEIELLPTGSEEASAFLGGLDCLIYRKHPHFFETCGTSILEAMAMGLPVVLFREGVGAAELIEHGQDGFLVDTEAEALACIDRLAADPGLRASIGAAARRKLVAVMQDQQARILTYYLGSA